jgi:hypothetical protein
VHVSTFSAATQALSILFHFICVSDPKAKHFNNTGEITQKPMVASSSKSGGGGVEGKEEGAAGLVNRFYRCLYEKLGSGDYLKTSKPTLFLNLIFKVGERSKVKILYMCECTCFECSQKHGLFEIDLLKFYSTDKHHTNIFVNH